jgi:hypothetical protein
LSAGGFLYYFPELFRFFMHAAEEFKGQLITTSLRCIGVCALGEEPEEEQTWVDPEELPFVFTSSDQYMHVDLTNIVAGSAFTVAAMLEDRHIVKYHPSSSARQPMTLTGVASVGLPERGRVSLQFFAPVVERDLQKLYPGEPFHADEQLYEGNLYEWWLEIDPSLWPSYRDFIIPVVGARENFGFAHFGFVVSVFPTLRARGDYEFTMPLSLVKNMFHKNFHNATPGIPVNVSQGSSPAFIILPAGAFKDRAGRRSALSG